MPAFPFWNDREGAGTRSCEKTHDHMGQFMADRTGQGKQEEKGVNRREHPDQDGQQRHRREVIQYGRVMQQERGGKGA